MADDLSFLKKSNNDDDLSFLKEFDYKPEQPGLGSDLAYEATSAANSGFAGLARTANTLFGDGRDGSITKRFEENAKYGQEQLSDAQKLADKTTFLSDDPNKTFGTAFDSLPAFGRKVSGVAAQGVGSFVPMLATGGPLSAGLKKGVLTAGAKAGGLAETGAGLAAYGGVEGAMTGGSAAGDIQQFVKEADINQLAKVPEFNKHFENYYNGSNFDEAVAKAREDYGIEIGKQGMVQAAALSAPFGAIGGHFIDKAITSKLAGNRARNALVGGLTEGLTESAQGGSEQYAKNIQMGKVDPSITPFKDVAESAISEGIGGGFPGAVFGALAPTRNNTLDENNQKLPENGPLSRAANKVSNPPGLGYQDKLDFNREKNPVNDTIIHPDGSTETTHSFYQRRLAEHGNADLARQETYQALIKPVGQQQSLLENQYSNLPVYPDNFTTESPINTEQESQSANDQTNNRTATKNSLGTTGKPITSANQNGNTLSGVDNAGAGARSTNSNQDAGLGSNADEAGANANVGVYSGNKQEARFKPTHLTSDNEPVIKIDEGLYIDADGIEIEDNYATPIKEVKNNGNNNKQLGSRPASPIQTEPQQTARPDNRQASSNVTAEQDNDSVPDKSNRVPDNQIIKRDPILEQSQGGYVANKLKEQGIKKSSPGFEQAKADIIDQYQQEREQAEFSLPFDEFKKLKVNKGQGEGILRQSYDAVRADLGIADTTPSESINNQEIDTNEKTQSVQPNKGTDNSADALVDADSATAQGISTGTEKSEELTGDKINKEWTRFADDSKSLNIPRNEMPQVKAEHRGALVNFLNGRGIKHKKLSVDPAKLKPTQEEFSPNKVNKAKNFKGGDRSIIISADNHVVDGHHQWLAKLDKGEKIDVIKLNSPIRKVLDDVKQFPSSESDDSVHNSTMFINNEQAGKMNNDGGNDTSSQQRALDEPKAKNKQVQVSTDSQSPNPQQDAAEDETKAVKSDAPAKQNQSSAIQGEVSDSKAGVDAGAVAKKKKPNFNKINDTDELKNVIGKLGGIKKTGHADRAGFSDYKGRQYQWIFNNGKNAKTLDEMAEALRDYGFDIKGENDLIQKLDGSLKGKVFFTDKGNEYLAELAAEAQYNDEEAQFHGRIEALLDAAKEADPTIVPQIEKAIEQGYLNSETITEYEEDYYDYFKTKIPGDSEKSAGKVEEETGGEQGSRSKNGRQDGDYRTNKGTKDTVKQSYGNQFDLFLENEKLSKAIARKDKQGAAGTGRQEKANLQDRSTVVANVKTSESKTGITRVTSAEDALHVISPISDSAQEVMVALALDSDGNILQLLKHSKGLADSSQVDVDHLVGSILDIPDAKLVYFAHNHPSGAPEQSSADKQITSRIEKIMKGTGLESKGMLVTSGDGVGSIYTKDDFDSREIIETNTDRDKVIPVTERLFQRRGKLSDKKITDPKTAANVVADISNNRTGIVLLDNQHGPVSFIGMSMNGMSKLKTNSADSGVGMILREIHATNSRAAIINIAKPDAVDTFKSDSVIDNVARFINSIGNTRILDALVDGKSKASAGYNLSKSGVFFSKVQKNTASTTAKQQNIDEFAEQVKDDLGLKSFVVFESELTGNIELSSLIVNKNEQKTGKGTQAIERLIAYADNTGKKIVLTPGLPNDSHGTTSRSRLVKFYKRFGFIESKGRNIDYALGAGKMYREPKTKFSKSTKTTGSTTSQVKSWLPRQAREMLGNGLEVVQSVEQLPAHLKRLGTALYHTVWHGSPHDHDKFDSSKIGTGEGAQAYGYGHYFAGRKEVAEWYRNILRGLPEVDNVLRSHGINDRSVISFISEDINQKNYDLNKVAENLESLGSFDAKTDSEIEIAINLLRNKPELFSNKNDGKLYQVELAPEQDEYLLWDKPLSEQSEKVKRLITSWLNKYEKTNGISSVYVNDKIHNGSNGSHIYNVVSEVYGGQDNGSDFLHSLGIRGIKYLDGSSRDKGEGNYNYVVFSDDDISITAKYAKGLAGVEGLYDPKSGKTYLVADMLNKDNINQVLNHEMLHKRLAEDPKLRKQLDSTKAGLREIFDKVDSGEYKGRYKDIYTRAMKRVNRAETKPDDRFEEFLAYSVSLFNEKPASIPERLKKLIQKLIGQIKIALMRFGVPVGKLTPADLNALAMQAMKFGPTNSAGENIVALASKQGYKGSDKGEAEEWLRAKAKGLDMSQEARMERARNMGFITNKKLKKIIGNRVSSGKDDALEIFYHGGPKNFDMEQFRPATGSSFYNPNNINGGYGFFTSSKGEAQGYADALKAKSKIPTKVHEFLIREVGKTHVEITSNGNYLPDYRELKPKGYGQTVVDLGTYGRGDDETYYRHEWMLPYSPNQIRSIHAAFDPDYADSGNLLASTSAAGKTTSEAFKRWFGRSKMKSGGEPIKFYHGSDADFTVFDSDKLSSNTLHTTAGLGHFFTRNKGEASQYGSKVHEVYLSMQNPYIITSALLDQRMGDDSIKFAEKLRRQGYDGIYIKDAGYAVAFESNQVKLTSNQTPTSDSDIRFSKVQKGGNSAWRNQPGFEDLTDEQFETLGKIGKPPNAPLKEKVKEQFNKHKYLWREKLKQGVFDQYDSFKSILNDKRAWMMANISTTGGAVVESAIEFGRPFLDSSGAIDSNTELKSLGQIFEPLGDEVDRFMMWIAGNRALRLSQEDRERLFSEVDIQNLIDMSKGNTKDGKSRQALYQKVRVDFEAMNNAFVKIGVDTGLVSQADAKIWKDQGFYVPFYRLADDMESTQGPASAGGLVKQQAYKKLKGADMQLNDLLTNAMMNWNHLINSSLKNQAATKALETAVGLGIAEEIQAKDKGKKSIFIRQDGKERWFNVDETQEGALILDSLNALNWNGLNNPAMKVMRKFKRALTVGVTASPEFKVANLLRDSIQAIAVSDMSTNIAKNLYEGFKYSAEEQATKARMIAGGGAFGDSGYIHGADPDAIKIVLEKGMDRANILDTRNKFKAVWDRYQDFGARLENVNRMANFEQALEQGKDLLTANFEARDQLDFQRTGSFVSVRAMAQVIPFLNARLQGLNKLGRAMNDHKQRKQFSAVVGVYSALSIMLYLAMKDDDDYKEAEQWERDTYHLFKLPGTDTMLRMPRPFEVGAIANMLERGVEQMVDDDAHGELFAERLKHAITQTLSIDIVPQAIKPINEVWANKSSFTGRDIESQAMQRLSPTERKKVWTSQTAIGLSKTMDAILWDDVVLSPIQVEHLVNGYLGWAGATVLSGIDMLARPLVGAPKLPEKTLHDMPVIGRFVRDKNPRNSRFITEFYDKQKELQTVFNDIKQYRENQEFEKANDKLDKYKDQLRFRKSINRAQRRLSDLNKRIRLITKSDASPEQKRNRIDKINAMRIDVARKAVSRLPN